MTDSFFNSRRSPVYTTGGMVAATQPLAVAAGLEILRRGGNAADAAIATAAALAVCEPFSTGLGGDCFALYYDAASSKVSALNGSGRAPAALTLERLNREGIFETLPPRHAYTVTVPGACAGWFDLIERHGRMAMGTILEPAMRLAEVGFPVAPLSARIWERLFEAQRLDEAGKAQLGIDGRGPQPGEIFRNPGMASVLRAIAAGGKAAFYQGAIAETIVRSVQAAGGCLEAADLANHTSTWDTPISTTYRGVRIWECPPNGQGMAALLALNLLEGFDIATLPALSKERLHLEIEAMRLAFADARRYVSDPSTNPIPLEALLSKEYAAQRRRLIDPRRAHLNQSYGSPNIGSNTVYLSVVDEDGNACSFINSTFDHFGNGITPPGCGFCLQNRGLGFSLNPEHPNALAPGKRPYHTIIPALATLSNVELAGGQSEIGEGDNSTKTNGFADPPYPQEQLYACFGVMGDYMQPQGHMQVVCGLLDDGLDPQAALDRPRFRIEGGDPGGRVLLEEGTSGSAMAGLAEMGHEVAPVSGEGRSVFGRGQVIVRDPKTGVLCGGSDPRGDGCAMTIMV